MQPMAGAVGFGGVIGKAILTLTKQRTFEKLAKFQGWKQWM